MSIALPVATALPAAAGWRLPFRLALRELRGGLKGFGIFLLCLALGVAAIATVQSVAGGVRQALDRDGRVLLGGDAAIRLTYTQATADDLRWLDGQGVVSAGAEMRAMAAAGNAPAGNVTALVELKAVDARYPLYGALTLIDGGSDLQARLAPRDGRYGAVIDDVLATRLGVAAGDALKVGDAVLTVRGIIAAEPDKLASGGFSLGPRLMVAVGALPATGLVLPGSLVNWTYQVKLPVGTDAAAWAKAAETAHAAAGWRVRDPGHAAPQLDRLIDRLAQFLTLVGLAALLVGGVGVGNAVRAHMDAKAEVIATLKCLGAPSRLIFQIYLVQIMILAGLGIALGLAAGAALPLLAGRLLAGLLPVTADIGVYPGRLGLAALFGLLTALVFSLWPLGRVRALPAARLFRDRVAPAGGRPGAGVLAALTLLAMILAGLAVLTADSRGFAAGFVGGAAAILLLFLGVGRLAVRLAAWLSRVLRRPLRRRLVWRLALANLHRPGNLTGAVILSLGLGLTLLVAIALIEGNFRREVGGTLPTTAPSFFFVDIQPDQLDDFKRTVLAVPGASDLETTPSLRGTVVAVNGVPAADALRDTSKAWVINGDRGVTWQAAAPAGDHIVAGHWWPADYQGPPLVAIANDVAKAFAIGPGATLTLSILGREMPVTVAVVRDINFMTLGINFALVVSPGVLDGAPQTRLATVKVPPGQDAALQAAVVGRFPNITAIRIRDALDTVARLTGSIATAVRVIASVALLTGALVLAGAIAAGQQGRVLDAVVLKVLGARRGEVMRLFLLEYGLLGLLAALVAAAMGTLVAWAVLTRVMGMGWVFQLGVVALTLVLGCAVTLALGGIATLRALGQPAAPLLRNE